MLAKNLAKIVWFMSDVDTFMDLEEVADKKAIQCLWDEFFMEMILKPIDA